MANSNIQPNKKTSEEADAGALAGTDLVRIVQGLGTGPAPWMSVKTTLASLKTYFAAGGGGGSGTVQSVVAGTGIAVDSTDPAHPIVSLSSSVSPLPTGCFAWYSVMQYPRTSGTNVFLMASPSQAVGVGSIGGALIGAVYNANGDIGAPHQFAANIAPLCNNITVMMVVRTPALNSGALSCVVSGSASGSLSVRLHGNSTGYFTELIKTTVVAYGDTSAATILPPSTLVLLTATINSSAWTLRHNGVQKATGTPSQMPSAVNDRIGSGAGNETPLHGLREVLYFDHVLNSTDMAAAESYLMTRHSIVP